MRRRTGEAGARGCLTPTLGLERQIRNPETTTGSEHRSMNAEAGRVTLGIDAGVATITFDRPQARNAMTWTMYQQLSAIAEQLKADPSVRAAVFRGAGGEAFVAGTDIEQFKAFRTGQDGLAYEARIEACVDLLESLPMPTVALIESWAIGGGLAIAGTCDFRIATTGSKVGVPIARTLGNCLSMRNLARLRGAFGHQRVKRMLMLAELIDTDEALACGFLHQVCEPTEIEQAGRDLVARLIALAPVTQRVSKEALRRLLAKDEVDGDDLIAETYGSSDFKEGVNAFVEKRRPVWTGR
jgi:enoyl-CoA hydratase